MTLNDQTEPSFQITLREVYNEVRGVSGKLDALNTLPHEVADHEARLRAVEANYVTKPAAARWLTGAITVVIACCAVLALVLHK